MDFEQALRVELTGLWYDFMTWDDNTLTYEVLDRVYPSNAPKGTKTPYLTYETSEHIGIKTMDGYSDTGTLECTIDVLGQTYTEMKYIAIATVNKIKTFLGRVIGEAGPYIQNVTFEDLQPENYEPNVDLHKKSITFTVFY